MKNFIIKALLLQFLTFSLFSQDKEGVNSLNHLRGFLIKSTQMESGIKSLTYKDIEGSPFLTKDFSLGTVHTKDGIFKNVKMKYDIYTDSFLFDLNGSELYLEASNYVKKVVLDQNIFVNKEIPNQKKKDNFLIELDSSKVSLYSKKNIYFRSEEPAKAQENGPTPAAFLPRANKYFVQIGSSPLMPIEKIKDFYELFPNQAEALKKYINTEDLSYKIEADLVKIARFLAKEM